MRIPNPAALLSSGAEETGLPGGNSDDWLERVNRTILNLKDLMKIGLQLKGDLKVSQNQDNDIQAPAPGQSPGQSPGLADYVQMAIQKGYGDIPVGKLIQEISPFTLKQIIGVLKNVRPQ